MLQTVMLEVSLFSLFFFSIPFLGVMALQIPLGSTITVAQCNYWVSPNRNFAFGFYNHSELPNLYAVGIRFNSLLIPVQDQAVVWVAGANVFVGKGSYLHLTQDGDMVLFDGGKQLIAWSSNTSHLSVDSAALLNDGNLVLLSVRGAVVWQSFKIPSDTLLPGQNLTLLQSLRAASRNCISSYYSLSMDSSHQLKLAWESNVSYWKTEATSSTPISALVFTNAGALQLLDQSSKPVWSSFGDDHNDPSVHFRFLRLDIDGNLRMYSWSEASRSWRLVWQAVQNQCEVFATCGLNGICVFTPTGNAKCKCPFHSTSTSSLYCLAPYKQNCSSGTGMLTLEHTFLYGIYPPHDSVIYTSVQGCKNSCLEDPLCTSVTVANDGSGQCLMKRTEFVTGYGDPSLASLSFAKVCLDPLAVIPRNYSTYSPSAAPTLSGSSHHFCTPYCFIGAVSGTIVVLFVIQIVVGICVLRRRKSAEKKAKSLSPNSIGMLSLSYAEIKNLTDDFSNQLGPNVYKGVLPNNQMIVVKDLKDLAQVEEKQFRCWISVLGSIYHKNLVKLEAYCWRSEHRFLVYQFAKNGSVDQWIEEAKLAKRLNWPKRIEICLGVARAMSYLHSGCREFVSHGNLKWKNVVLDEQLEAKLTEYGFGRFCGSAHLGSHLAEEDVARFGEMLVVMVSGHRGGSEVCWWAYKEWVEGRIDRLIDSRMGGKPDFEEIERTLRVAFWCVQDDERLRPSMGEVTKVLEGLLSVDPPPPFRMPDSIVEPAFQIEELC